MSKQNGEWQSMVVKLKKSHGNTLKTLKKVESKMEALNMVNKTLGEKNIGSNISMQRITKQCQDLSIQLEDVKKKCNVEKTNAFEHCYKTVEENKKKQWCMMCQKEGGRYYCSTQCEEYYWYVLFDYLKFDLCCGLVKKLMLFSFVLNYVFQAAKSQIMSFDTQNIKRKKLKKIFNQKKVQEDIHRSTNR